MLLTKEDQEEKRERRSDPGGAGQYTRGINRIEEVTLRDLEEHDAFCNANNVVEWYSGYSLLNHHVRVSQVMVAIGTARRRSQHLILVSKNAALMHDTGKLEEKYRIYRLNRKLTPEEKLIMSEHAEQSGSYVLRRMSDIRAEDRAFLSEVHPIVSFHHEPWRINDPQLREIGFDLHLSDIFVSMMEDRERPGLSQFEAIEVLHTMVEQKLKEIAFIPHEALLLQSLLYIVQLYGVDFDQLRKEFGPSA